MTGRGLSAYRHFFPPVPDAVRDALTIVQFDRMRSHIPLLYVTLSLNLCAAVLAGTPDSPAWVRTGIPLVVLTLSLARIRVWMKRRERDYTADEAAVMLRKAAVPFVLNGGLCSLWCVYIWFTDTTDFRLYAPIFIIMGSFATTYCLSSSRGYGMLNQLITIAPIAGLLVFSGEVLPMAMGISIFLGALFLGRLVMQQHDHLVEMLALQQQMHDLARVDPLTGLLNRRALFEKLEAAIADVVPDKRPAVAILDLDNFKPVNDNYGHAMGDKLLQEVAHRLTIVCGSMVDIARLGGDEFAIVASNSSADISEEIVRGIEVAISLPFRIDGIDLRVGVSIGRAVWTADHIDMHCLLADADERLYAAKAAPSGEGERRGNFRLTVQEPRRVEARPRRAAPGVRR